MTGSVDSAVEMGAPITWAIKAAPESAHAVTNFNALMALLRGSFAIQWETFETMLAGPPSGTGICTPSTHRPERAETYSRAPRSSGGDRGQRRVMVSTLRYTADRECRHNIPLELIRASTAGRREGKFHHEHLEPRAVVVVDGDLNFVEQRMHPLP